MKKIIGLLFCGLIIPFFYCNGTPVAKAIPAEIIAEDSVLKKIAENLPSGWSMIVSDTLLILERKDSALFCFHFDEINGPDIPGPTDDEIDADTKAHGYMKKFRIIYKLEPKWTIEKKQLAIAHNDSIYDSIHLAWNKYGIEKFYHRAPVTNGKMWDTDHPEPKTKADSINLEKYNAENERLRRSLIKLPELGTENYAMFASGYDNECFSFGQISYPRSASNEQAAICSMIWDLCDLRKEKK